MKKKGVYLIIFVLMGILSYRFYSDALPEENEIQLAKCIDGDTAKLSVNGEEKTLRFLAIDTPETVKPNTEVEPYGKEASKMTCSLLKNAKEIKLEYEENNLTDKYDRLLAWVWVDGELLQHKLVAEGYAEVKYIYGEYKYTEQLEAMQEYAKQQKKGIWGN